MVDRVEGDRVILDQPATEAKRRCLDEVANAASSATMRIASSGPHILNRAFSGTYER